MFRGGWTARKVTALAVLLSAAFVVPAQAQTVQDFNINGRNLRLEIWNQSDGNSFSWSTYNFDVTHDFSQAEIDAIGRGVQYWVDILGPNNTPGRDMVFRVLRNDNIGANANSNNIFASVGTLRTAPQYIWADGFNTAAQTSSDGQELDTVIQLGDLPWSTDPTGQLFNGGTSIEAVVIHELGHSLGMLNFQGTWGIIGLLTAYEALLVDANGNPVVSGASFTASDPFFFTGANAMTVYGDRVPTTMFSLQKSHLGIDPLLMTHESYRNYPFFTEVELAVIQDMGFDIDRSKFFGRSFYQNGNIGDPVIVNNTVFNSTATYGIGLHVKANQLNILQNADLFSGGAGGAGIRIDGHGNLITVGQNVNIAANNNFGVGILVSNGTGNVIVHRGTINADSTTASQEGTGLLFSFGSNLLPNGNRTSASAGMQGNLVDRADITGTISAGGKAIHIDSTAAVGEINIMNGAHITGNITSNALVDDSLGLNRPTITFGHLADADGIKTSAADPNFHIQYNGNIDGTTAMDAEFVGGIGHQTGTELNGITTFNRVNIHSTGRVTANGLFVSANQIDVHGALSSTGGLIGTLDDIHIHNGGHLSGTPTIVANNLNAQPGSLISPGNSIGTMTYAGNFNANGNFDYEISHLHQPQDADRIDVVAGTATINGATTFANRGTFHFRGETSTAAGDYSIGRRYTVLTTDGPGKLLVVHRPNVVDDIVGRRVILRTNTDLAGFYTPGAQYLYAYIGRDASYAGLATTPNQHALGAYLDSLAGTDDGSASADQLQWLLDTLDLMPDESQVLAAFSMLNGEIYATVNPLILQELYRSQNQLAARLRNDGSRLSVCDPFGNRNANGWTGWITGFGLSGQTHFDGNASGYHVSSGGMQAVVGYGAGCDTLVGGFYDYAGMAFSQNQGAAQVDLNEWGLFLSHTADFVHFLAIGSGGTSTYDVNRGVSFGNTAIQLPIQQTYRGNFDGSYGSVYGEIGLQTTSDWLTMRPFMGLGYTHLNTEGFTEDGDAFGLNVREASIDSLRSMLGLDLNILLTSQNNLTWDFRSAWMHDFLFGGVQQVQSGFGASSNGGFTVAGTDIGRDFAVLGTGLSLNLIPDRMRITGGYDLIFNRHQTLQTGSGTLELMW